MVDAQGTATGTVTSGGRASKLFHPACEHPTYTAAHGGGLRGDFRAHANHPVLCLVEVAGVPTLLWKLLIGGQPTATAW